MVKKMRTLFIGIAILNSISFILWIATLINLLVHNNFNQVFSIAYCLIYTLLVNILAFRVYKCSVFIDAYEKIIDKLKDKNTIKNYFMEKVNKGVK